MTTQDEDTGLKPVLTTTPGPTVVDPSADITGMNKRSEDGGGSSLLLSKSKSAVSTEDGAVADLPPTAASPPAEPPTEGRGDVTDVLSPNKPNSVVDGKDDAIVELLSTTESLITKFDGDDDALPLSKLKSVVAAKDDVVVESPLTTESPATKHGRDDDTRLPNKKSKLLDQQSGDEDCKSPSATELKPPVVNDFSDFTRYSECTRFGETGERLSMYTFVMMVDSDNHAAWLGTVDAPNAQVKLKQAVESLCRIPDEVIYPPVTPGMQTIAVTDYTPDDETWLKRPLIHAYKEGDSSARVAGLFLDEIKAHQLVGEHPHRNLVKFKGCLEKDGLVVGVLQKRYPMTLEFRVEAWSQPPYDATAFYNDIEAGLKHLHSLGYAHNDLNPNNVMVDAEDRLVIIDLGAAMPLGQFLHQGGTAGWNTGFEENSSVSNDEIGLRLIKEYLEEHRKKE